ncbi:MAG TPA: hypothetical protein VFY19_09290, partial [Geminicoccaceae bacterium]|nr:hypothetical protein [Geminicoccaceae bacterium]
LIAFAFDAQWPRAWPLNAVMLIAIAYLMVSRIPTFSIKTVLVRVRPEWVLPTLIFVGLFVAALTSAPWHTLLAVGVVYLTTLPVGWWSAYRLRRRHERVAEATAPAATTTPSAEAPAAGTDRRVVDLGGPRGGGRTAKPDGF